MGRGSLAFRDRPSSRATGYADKERCRLAARHPQGVMPLTSVVSHRGQVLTVVAPTLSSLQEQILTLLGVGLSAYDPVAPRPGKST